MATSTLSSASSISIPKLSDAKSLPNRRCSFIVFDAQSALPANLLRNLKPFSPPTPRLSQQIKTLVVCLSRASSGDGSGYTSDSEDDGGENIKEDRDDLPPASDSIEIVIEKTGNNSRRIKSKVGVQASLQTVWDILTDYERLADFIPGLVVSKLLEKRDNYARLFQIGEQNLAFGLKFNAKGTIDCVEKDLEILPFGQKRDIDFKMVEGDFQLFEGKWSVEQELKPDSGDLQSGNADGVEFETTLVYVVHVKPKVWLPVRLVEGRLCNEIRTNLLCIREEAEKAFQDATFMLL